MSSEALPDDPETLKAMLLAERVQNDRLRQIIKELQRHRFGRRAETLPEDQMLLSPGGPDMPAGLARTVLCKPRCQRG
jgi:transposase